MQARPTYTLAVIALIALSGCERAKPTSYLIPKESREVAMPRTPDSPQATTKAASTAGDNNMRVLPGMQEAANQAGEISYTVPNGWEELPASGLRKANLKITNDRGSAELTVLVFPGDVGGDLANINRWRGQIGLPAASLDELSVLAQDYSISGHRGQYVKLEGSEKSILGGLLPFHGSTWFFKLLGDNSVVLTNELEMKAFLDSVQIDDPHH